jgi:hypothetical protein
MMSQLRVFRNMLVEIHVGKVGDDEVNISAQVLQSPAVMAIRTCPSRC